MTKRYRNSFRNNMLEYVDKLPGVVILREDVKDLASPRQVSRGLKALVEDQVLVKLGSGVYAKARPSRITNDAVIRSGFTNACIEALERLNVEWEPGQALKDYNEGKSQQIPMQLEVRLKSRFRRKISYKDRSLGIEGMIYGR